jgi:hypothetical protein
MLISLNGTFYHYCGIDPSTVSSLLRYITIVSGLDAPLCARGLLASVTTIPANLLAIATTR